MAQRAGGYAALAYIATSVLVLVVAAATGNPELGVVALVAVLGLGCLHALVAGVVSGATWLVRRVRKR
jgi:hypothetical protein